MASCLIMIGPGVGGLGGFKYLTPNSCTWSTQHFGLSLTTSGVLSLLIWYSDKGISPFQFSTSALLSQMPLMPFISMISVSRVGKGALAVRIDSSHWLTYGGSIFSLEHGGSAVVVLEGVTVLGTDFLITLMGEKRLLTCLLDFDLWHSLQIWEQSISINWFSTGFVLVWLTWTEMLGW